MATGTNSGDQRLAVHPLRTDVVLHLLEFLPVSALMIAGRTCRLWRRYLRQADLAMLPHLRPLAALLWGKWEVLPVATPTAPSTLHFWQFVFASPKSLVLRDRPYGQPTSIGNTYLYTLPSPSTEGTTEALQFRPLDCEYLITTCRRHVAPPTTPYSLRQSSVPPLFVDHGGVHHLWNTETDPVAILRLEDSMEYVVDVTDSHVLTSLHSEQSPVTFVLRQRVGGQQLQRWQLLAEDRMAQHFAYPSTLTPDHCAVAYTSKAVSGSCAVCVYDIRGRVASEHTLADAQLVGYAASHVRLDSGVLTVMFASDRDQWQSLLFGRWRVAGRRLRALGIQRVATPQLTSAAPLAAFAQCVVLETHWDHRLVVVDLSSGHLWVSALTLQEVLPATPTGACAPPLREIDDGSTTPWENELPEPRIRAAWLRGAAQFVVGTSVCSDSYILRWTGQQR